MAPATARIALLIDGENAQPSLIPQLLEALTPYGNLVVQRVYGDWLGRQSGWREMETRYGIQMIQQSRYASGKNAADIAMTVAAMDLLHTKKISVFCIVSSDSDFTPLVVRLRDEGAIVIGVGKQSTPQPFVNACFVFITIERLVKPKQPQPQPTKPGALDPQIALPLVQQAYEQANKEEGWVFLGILGGLMRKLDPTFDPKLYGQKGLSQLVAHYEDVFEFHTKKDNGTAANLYLRLKE